MENITCTMDDVRGDLSLSVILYYWSFQCDTDVVVLIFNVLGFNFLCYRPFMYVIIF